MTINLLNNKKGFTLSELLVSLGIIGIIAALTVPAVVAKHQRKSMILGLQKTYSEFTQTIDLFIVNEYSKKIFNSKLSIKGDALSDENVEKSVGKFLKKYFRVSLDCGMEPVPCFAEKYKSISGTIEDFKCDGYSITNESGVAICMLPAEANELKAPAVIYVDINGNEKPNIGGRDIFTFEIYDDATIDEGVKPEIKSGKEAGDPETIRETNFNTNCLKSSYGKGCFGKLINENWKAEY